MPSLAYLVSRFPTTTETFWLRELDEMNQQDRFQLSLYSLFPSDEQACHNRSERWLSRHRRARLSTTALLYWIVRRPLRLMTSLIMVSEGYWSEPKNLVKAWATFLFSLDLARQMRRERVGHIHAHFVSWPLLAAWTIERLAGISYSTTAHSSDFRLSQAFLRQKFSRAQFIVSISETNRQFLLPYAGKRPVVVIRQGLPLELFPYKRHNLAAEGPWRIISVASLLPVKGQRHLIEALAEEGLGNFTLDLVGAGPEEEELRRLVINLSLEKRVRFHGRLNEEEVSALLGESDIFALTSIAAPDGKIEGLPVALMEAMASGLPVVASDIGSIPELVKPGQTGRLAVAGDKKDIARHLVEVAARADQSQSLAAAGRQLIEQDYDVVSSSQRLADRLQHCLSSTPIDGAVESEEIDLSLIVPIYNESNYIEQLISDIRGQDFAGSWEVLLVDGRSSDDTRAKIKQLTASDPLFRLIDNPERTTPYALNHGLAAARGAAIARMDAHSSYPAHYLSSCYERLLMGDVAWVAGPFIAAGQDGWSRRITLAMNSRLGIGSAQFRRSLDREIETNTAFCGLLRKTTLLDLGGWDEDWRFNQDAELAARVRKAGGKIVCLPGLDCAYQPRNSLSKLAQQYFRYGLYRMKTVARHNDALSAAHLLPPGIALAAICSVAGPLRRPARLGLGLWLVALISSIWPLRRRADSLGDLLAVPLCLAVMHLSWGLGALLGVIRFWPGMRGRR